MTAGAPAVDAPAGFVLRGVGTGFASPAIFGPLYVCMLRGLLGFRVAERHLNPVGVCNGGAMATFADMQIVALEMGAGTGSGHQPTITLSVDYLAPAPLGSWVEAAVTLVKTTRTLIFSQAMITADRVSVARSNAIYRRYVKTGHGQGAPSG